VTTVSAETGKDAVRERERRRGRDRMGRIPGFR